MLKSFTCSNCGGADCESKTTDSVDCYPAVSYKLQSANTFAYHDKCVDGKCIICEKVCVDDFKIVASAAMFLEVVKLHKIHNSCDKGTIVFTGRWFGKVCPICKDIVRPPKRHGCKK